MTGNEHPEGEPQDRSYQFEELRFGLGSTDPGALHWLEEFLTPAFPRIAPRDVDLRFRLRTDDDEYLACADGFSSQHETLDCFQMDGGFERLAVDRRAPGVRLLFDARQRAVYRLDEASARVDCLTPRDSPHRRKAFLRIVREFAMARSWSRRRILVHASACAVAGRAMLIAGPKQAGKTTLLLHCLRVPGAEILTNDRAVLDLEDDALRASGIPTYASIRPGTLQLIPALEAVLRERNYDSRLALDEAPHGETRPFQPDQNIYLTPAQIAGATARPLREAAELGAILFPRKTAGHGIELLPMTGRLAAERLCESLFGGPSRGRVSPAVLPDGESLSEPAIAAICEEVVDRAPCFECKVGAGSFASPETASALLERALGR
jgi:hypothetical protein